MCIEIIFIIGRLTLHLNKKFISSKHFWINSSMHLAGTNIWKLVAEVIKDIGNTHFFIMIFKFLKLEDFFSELNKYTNK